jgi:hypothetical protein
MSTRASLDFMEKGREKYLAPRFESNPDSSGIQP